MFQKGCLQLIPLNRKKRQNTLLLEALLKCTIFPIKPQVRLLVGRLSIDRSVIILQKKAAEELHFQGYYRSTSFTCPAELRV